MAGCQGDDDDRSNDDSFAEAPKFERSESYDEPSVVHAAVVAVPDDDDELLKRRETARVVGVSETTVRRWADRGVLTPIVGPDGVHRYRAGEVRELTVRKVKLGPLAPDEYDGAAAATVFRLLDDGVHPIDIVKR